MRSASVPRRPMTMPGRAVWMSTRTRSRVRSISTLEMPARSMPLESMLADRDVFLDVLRVLLVGVPPGLPVGGDTEPEAVRIDFLAHQRALPFPRLRLARAPGCAAGRRLDLDRDVAGPLADPVGAALGARSDALERSGPRPRRPAATTSVSGSRAWLFSAFAAALAITLSTASAAACGANRRMSSASAAGRPLISSITRRAFVGDTCTYLRRPRALWRARRQRTLARSAIVAPLHRAQRRAPCGRP